MLLIYKIFLFRKPPLSTGDWSKLLEQQQYLHEEEIRRWKEILSASVQLLDHVSRVSGLRILLFECKRVYHWLGFLSE